MAKGDTKTTELPSSGKTPFIDSSTAASAYNESNNWFKPYFDPIEEFERIARNKPSTKIDPQLPRVTDGTMAAIVQESPKRVIQQLADGLIECYDYPGYAKIADIVHREKLLPMYNRMGTALQKHWNMLAKAMTWGRSSSYTFFTSTNGQLHTDFVIPYVKDVLTEKGKVYAPDSNISFMRSWYQRRDLQAIINREKAFKERNPKYQSEWNLPLIAEFMEAGASAKPADQQTAAEREKGGDNGGYEVIHAFQTGQGAEFYSFAPRFKNGENLRTKINKDPRGKMPLDFEYCNIDLSNPLGRGQVELSGGVQNLVDQQMQMFQFITTLMMGPPLQVWGDPNKATLKFRPNAVWDMGTNPQNKVEPYTPNNSAIEQFAGNFGLLKSQILNLNSSQDHSISGADTPNQSKTQAGVKASEARLGVSDNYLRKQHETWFADQSETSINLYFAEMTGTEEMLLKGEDLKELSKSNETKQFVKGNKLTVPYKQISNVTFKFQTDASSSEVKEDADNVEKLTEALKLVQTSQNPEVLKVEPKIIKLLFDEIGAEGTDDLFPDENKVDENGNAVQQPANDPNAMMQQMLPVIQQMVQQMMQEEKAKDPAEHPIIKLMESLNIKFETLPEDAKQQVLAQIGIQTQMPSPTQQTIDQKQQVINQGHDKNALEIAKTAHQHTMDAHNSIESAAQTQQQNELSRHQIDTNAAQKANVNTNGAKSTQSKQPAKPATQQPTQSAAPDHTASPLSPEEQQVVQALLQRGFSEQDAEQAIVMMRQGMPNDQIMSALGAKYARQQ